MASNINQSKLMGGKRKNGHKSTCTCHICENMRNKARRGGYEEEVEKQKENMMGGSKKKNGHRKACMCPICKNMKNSKKRGGSKSSRRTRRRRGGDDEDDTDTSDEEEEMGEEEVDDQENAIEDKQGGKRKRGNGHKKTCKCPICKNMRKSKRGGEEPDEENQLGDIEEAGVRASTNSSTEQPTPAPETPAPETPASDDEYDELSAAEEGRAGPNSNVGGTRKRRRGGKKWGGKKRKTHRRHRRH